MVLVFEGFLQCEKAFSIILEQLQVTCCLMKCLKHMAVHSGDIDIFEAQSCFVLEETAKIEYLFIPNRDGVDAVVSHLYEPWEIVV